MKEDWWSCWRHKHLDSMSSDHTRIKWWLPFHPLEKPFKLKPYLLTWIFVRNPRKRKHIPYQSYIFPQWTRYSKYWFLIEHMTHQLEQTQVHVRLNKPKLMFAFWLCEFPELSPQHLILASIFHRQTCRLRYREIVAPLKVARPKNSRNKFSM